MSETVKGHARPKEEPQIEAEKSKDKDSRKEAKKDKAEPQASGRRSLRILGWFKDPNNQRICGAVLVFFSLLLFFSFASYLFTWREDQSLFGKSFGDLFFDQTVVAANWLGKLGALLSHIFFFQFFGIAGLVIVLNLFVFGIKLLFDIKLLDYGPMIKHSILGMLWVSTAINFVMGSNFLYLGGATGFELNAVLSGWFGQLGNGFLLCATGFVWFIGTFKPNFDWVKERFEQGRNQPSTPEPVADQHHSNDFLNKISQVELTDDEDEEPAAPWEEPLEEEILFVDNSTIEAPKTEPVTEFISEGDQQLELAPVSDEKELSETELELLIQDKGEFDPTLDLSSYQFPTLDLLDGHATVGIDDRINKEELLANQKRIVETLANYKIDIDKIKAAVGPTVTLYEIVPAPGIRISKIQSLENDIALSLAALGIRIIAPIPGKGTIGIEVPNTKAEMVPMKTLLRSDRFAKAEMDLPVALGKTISNETFVADLAKMPHLLMAGATGQGKSVGLNAILVSLLYKKHPSQIKFVLVDPKKVELTLFNKIERHFLAKLPDEEEAIITDTSKVVRTLNSLCVEMDNRYEMLKNAQVRNIKEYNAKFVSRRLNPEKGHMFLPYIIVVVDEFADLIMTAGKEVETPIARIAQLARAVGIHLIIATQRPSVNIITGVIKANFPSRIAFRVSSKVDSRTILDTGGAEQLIGRGDMLYSSGNDLIRIQCGFVDTPEVERITEFIGNQRGYPSAFDLPEVSEDTGGSGGNLDVGDRDELFEEAARIVVQNQQGSASLLQRKLQLGYNRAGRLIDQLEAAGVVGPFKGSKAREVLFQDLLSLEQFLSNSSK
ncbi:MAG TPA: DNA translocase FtsK [Luteibaculaceae bacterium]|nr:DNA translocase FtsK [Luteibaculaceae bacterium]